MSRPAAGQAASVRYRQAVTNFRRKAPIDIRRPGPAAGPGGNRRYVLGEDFLTAGSFQVALLSGQACRLLDRSVWAATLTQVSLEAPKDWFEAAPG